jgi:hypothetical protein
MNPDRFVKVFDLLDVGRDWTFLAVGLIFVVIGIVVAAFPTIVKATGIPFFNFTTRPRKFFRYGFLLFVILWTAVTFSITYSQYSQHKSLVQSGSCRVVQGPIEHFVPMPYGGHAQESFSVSGIVFRYSDFIITGGFNNTSSHGGPINSGSYVRICYDPSDNAILRLEIRDLKGETKNYANSTSIFPPSSDMRRANGESPIPPPWYSSLISVLFFFDLAAIQMMFLPYLGTFFRIKTVPVGECPIYDGLLPDKKVKLRNSMIYWERENCTIWLRPRGFNFLQIPLTIAKLRVDDRDRSIIEYEIRFSSGFPLLVALILWIGYSSFSAAVNGSSHTPPPAALIFVAFVGLMILIGFLNLRLLRSRMDKLVRDGLSDLDEMRVPGPWG